MKQTVIELEEERDLRIMILDNIDTCQQGSGWNRLRAELWDMKIDIDGKLDQVKDDLQKEPFADGYESIKRERGILKMVFVKKDAQRSLIIWNSDKRLFDKKRKMNDKIIADWLDIAVNLKCSDFK